MTAEVSPSEHKILEAARKVFEINGFGGARMQQIADEAGISKASLHYYFRTKENLFDRIFEVTMSEFMELVSTWSDESDAWEDKLRKFIHNFFEFLQTKSLLFLLGEINRNPALIANRLKKPKPKARFIAYFEQLLGAGKIKMENINVVYIFLHSLCAYPVLNRSMFRMTMGLNDQEYSSFMKNYPDTVADLLISILKKGIH